MGVHYRCLSKDITTGGKGGGAAKIIRTIKFLVRLIVFDVPSFAVSSDKQLCATSSNVHDAFDPTHFSPPPKPVRHQDHIKL